MQNTKYKTITSCGCKKCKTFPSYRKYLIKCSKRKVRRDIKQELDTLVDFDSYILNKVSIVWTD